MDNFNAKYEAVLSTRIERKTISLPKGEYLQMAKGLSELVPVRKPLFFEKVIDLNFNCSA